MDKDKETPPAPTLPPPVAVVIHRDPKGPRHDYKIDLPL